jgi:hypothetical protein
MSFHQEFRSDDLSEGSSDRGFGLVFAAFCSIMAARDVWLSGAFPIIVGFLCALCFAIDAAFQRDRLLFCGHHMSLAASASYPSPFADAVVLTMDGFVEWATASFNSGSGGLRIHLLKLIHLL